MIQIFNKKLRIFATTTLILALIAVSTSVPATAVQRERQNGGILRVGTVQEPLDIFNPAVWSQTGFPLLIYSGMAQWNENLELVPDLAEDWSVSADGLTLTYVLREGLKFSDGHPLTSEDVEFSVHFFTEMSPVWSNYYEDKGLPTEESTETVTGKAVSEGALETPDDRTIIFHVSEPSATALTEFAGWYVLPQHFFEGHDVTIEKDYVYQNPPCSGVFKLKEYVPGSHWWLERNEYYHTPSYLDGAIFQIFGDAATMEIALINGDIDHCWEWPSADWMTLSQYPQLELQLNAGWGIRFVWFNHDPKLKDGSVNPCADINVRKAIYHAIDIPAVLDATVGAGFYELISQPQPTFLTVGGYSVQADLPTPLFEYNPETAKALLKDAGYGGGMELKYYIRSGDPVILAMAQFFKSYLDAVGIDLEINIIESTVFYDIVAFTADPHEWHLSYATTDCSPDAYVGPFYILHEDMIGVWNWGHWRNSEFSQLITDGFTEVDDEKRADLYKKAHVIAADEVACMWLFNVKQQVAYNEDFKGWRWVDHPNQGWAHGLYPLTFTDLYYVPAQQVTFIETETVISTVVAEFAATLMITMGLTALTFLVPLVITRRRMK